MLIKVNLFSKGFQTHNLFKLTYFLSCLKKQEMSFTTNADENGDIPL